jgi:hypothetical protein
MRPAVSLTASLLWLAVKVLIVLAFMGSGTSVFIYQNF